MNNQIDPLVDQQLLFEILEKLRVAVYVSNGKGELCYVNPAAVRLDHLKENKDIGRKFSDIWGANSLAERDSPTLDTVKTGRVHAYENLEWHLVDGTKVNAITSSYPIERNGHLAGAFTLAEDINSLKKHLIKQGAFRHKQYYKIRKEMLKNGTEYTLDDIIGRSKEIRDSISLARRLAEKQFPVLVYGETGTGKELFAQGIHNASPVAGGQFVAINCAAIPETLLESVLFGSTKGAFTGATDREGLFEKANGGTLFLDEINSMPITLQPKLLRAIQEKEIHRLGSSKTIKTNCRIISATNKEPQLAIEQGELREDLYYRLAMGSVVLPPLRERKEDIDDLVDYYIAKVNSDMDTTVIGVSETLLQMLKSYGWPGNIRELFNTVANAIIMSSDSDIMLDVDHIPNFMIEAIYKGYVKEDASTDVAARTQQWKKIRGLPTEGNINEMVDAYEEMLLRSAMETSRGKVTHAAEMLGISRQALYVKLKKYQINKEAMK